MSSQDNRLLPLTTPAGHIDRPLRELTQNVQVTGSYSLPEPTHLRDYLNIVLKRKWLILSLVTVVTTLVAIQMYRLPSIYEAKTTIQIEQRARALFKTKDVVLNAGTDPAYWNTQLKLLENPSLHRQVILKLGLQNNPAFLGGQARSSFFTTLRRVVARNKGQTEEAPAANNDGGLTVADESVDDLDTNLSPQQRAALEPYEDALAANLTVEPVERTNLVNIRFRHNDPAIARAVANELAQAFIERDQERESEGMRTAKISTGKQITELQKHLEDLQKDYAAAMVRIGSPVNPTTKGVNIIEDQANTLSQQWLAARDELTKAQSEYDAAQRAMTASDIFSIPAVQESKSVQELQTKLNDLNEKRQALLQQYTPEWPEVKKVDAQIKQTEEARKRAANAIVVSLGAKLDKAKRQAADLERSYNEVRSKAQAQDVQAFDLNTKAQELETTKQALNTAMQHRQELENASVEGEQNNIVIQTPARTPELVGPPRVRNIMIALLLALGAGIGLAFLLDYLDDTLKSIEDVDRHIHLPTLALIPAPREARRLALGRSAPAHASDTTALALIEEVRSPVTEAYRHLRTSLLLSSAGQPPRTMLVTSSQPSEGKTTTAVNTAMMLAQTGAEVLLVDCDLRRPRIHTHFQMSNARGVTNYLSGETNISELLQTYDKQPNLKVITSGPVPPNAAELLGSEQMRRLLQLLSEEFTHIIIDSPPAISFTDASILSTMVDGVVLVVHGGRSSRAIVRRAKQQLLDVGAHLFGIVLNNVKIEGNDYYYGYGYYSNYYANDDESEAAAAGADSRGAQS